MIQQFKSMNELVEYLGAVEARLKALEQENVKLRAAAPAGGGLDENAIVRSVARALPQTSLISANFFKRAFTVWGHFMVANFIIGIIGGLIYACLMMIFLGSFLGQIQSL